MAEKKTDKAKTLLAQIAENPMGRKVVLVIGLVGIGLICLSSFFSLDSTGKNENEESCVSQISAEDYAQQLQSSLEGLLGKIEGVGDPTVLVTLEKDAEQVYATEEKISTQTAQSNANDNRETNYIIVKDANGNQRAIKVTEVQPVVKGVVVVCSGAVNPVVQQNVIDAVTTALNITSVKVCVIKAK